MGSSLLKKPILPIALIFVYLLYMNIKAPELFNRKEKISPTSCRAVLVMLDKRIPKTWETKCKENHMTVIINEEENSLFKNNRSQQETRPIFYKMLANHLSFISKNSPEETLGRVNSVTVDMKSPLLEAKAFTSGLMISKMATLSDPGLLATHLQQTVKIQEIRPKK